MIPNITELLIVFLIVLILFGAGKIPRIAEDLGKGIKSFKKGLKEGETSGKSSAEVSSSETGSNKSGNNDDKAA